MKHQTQENTAPELGDVLESIYRHKWIAYGFFLIVVVVTVSILAFLPQKYTSTSKLIVRGCRESAFIDPTGSAGSVRPVYKTWESEINSELEILGSRELIQDVVLACEPEVILAAPYAEHPGRLRIVRETLNPLRRSVAVLADRLREISNEGEVESESTKIEKAIAIVENNLTISARENSDIIIVSYTAPTPELAKKVVQQLVESYLERRIDIHRIPGAYQFFSQQTEALLKELNMTEESIQSIINQAGVGSFDESRTALQKTIESVREQYLKTKASMAATDARTVALRSRLSNMNDLEKHSSVDPLLKILDSRISGTNNYANSASIEPVPGILNSMVSEVDRYYDEPISESLRSQLSIIDDSDSSYSDKPVPDILQSMLLEVDGIDNRITVKSAPKIVSANISKMDDSENNPSVEPPPEVMLSQLSNLDEGVTDDSVEPIKIASLMDPDEYRITLVTLRGEESTQPAQEAESKELYLQLVQLQEELAKLNELDAPLQRLKREKELLESKYRKYDENRELARINNELETRRISNVNIVQHATLPIESNPSGALYKVIAALFLGLTGSVGIAYCADYMDPTISSASDVAERAQLTTLIELPQMHSKDLDISPSNMARRANRIKYKGRLYDRSVDKYFEDLFFKILSLCSFGKPGPIVVGITSSQEGEGVSTIASNLAQSFHNDDRFPNTLLLDAHIDRHSDRLIKQLQEASFTYQRITDVEYEEFPEGQNHNASKFIKHLSTLRRMDYDVIVVDMPSMSAGNYAVRIAEAVGLTVLVIDSSHTPWRTVRWASDLLTNSHTELCGTVLNRKRFAMPEWLHHKV